MYAIRSYYELPDGHLPVDDKKTPLQEESRDDDALNDETERELLEHDPEMLLARIDIFAHFMIERFKHLFTRGGKPGDLLEKVDSRMLGVRAVDGVDDAVVAENENEHDVDKKYKQRTVEKREVKHHQQHKAHKYLHHQSRPVEDKEREYFLNRRDVEKVVHQFVYRIFGRGRIV